MSVLGGSTYNSNNTKKHSSRIINRPYRMRVPGIVIIIAILLAYKAGVFDSVPALKGLIQACLNLLDWGCEKLISFLQEVLQGPLVEIGDVMFPPLG